MKPPRTAKGVLTVQNKRYKPKFDKLTLWIWIPTAALLLAATALSVFYPIAFIIMLAADIFTFYFLATSFAAYVEVGEQALFIKFGFIKKREIPYNKIRGISRERKIYADSMMSIKNSLDHINIKYNSFDIVSVSVIDNEALIADIERRRAE